MSNEGDKLAVETRIVDARVGSDMPLPTYATAGSAGMDLRACLSSPAVICPGETLLVGSGVAVFIRSSAYMGVLAPRSGLGVKHGIVLANTIGIIDSDYQDEIRIALHNRGTEAYALQPGERVCQLIFVPVAQATLRLVKTFSNETARGTGGFGSTGKT